MSETQRTKQTLFVTIVRTEMGRKCARVLIESLRQFGGNLSNAPLWVFEANPEKAPCQSLVGPGVTLQQLSIPKNIKNYIFSDKVSACALAEERAPREVTTLAWLDPTLLVVAPPVEYVCEEPTQATLRPVHIQNVGSLRTAEPDAYWKGIFGAMGVKDVGMSVESFVDSKPLRAYFNTHAFAVNPQKKLMQQWLVEFEKSVCDKNFQAATCSDDDHQVFLHQAVLSTLLATRLDAEEICILPPTYNYPYHLHGRVPEVRQAQRLNDVVTAVIHEEGFVDLTKATKIKIEEPLRSWLVERYNAF